MTAMSSSGQSSHSVQAGLLLPLPSKAHLREGIHSFSGATGPFDRVLGFLSLGAELGLQGCALVWRVGWNIFSWFLFDFVSICKQRAAQQESCS